MNKRRKRSYQVAVNVDREKIKKLAKKGKPRNKRERRLRRGLKHKVIYEECLLKNAQLDYDLQEARRHRVSDDDDDDHLLPKDIVDSESNVGNVPSDEKDSSSSDDSDELLSDGCEKFAVNHRIHGANVGRRTLLPIRTISGRVIRVESTQSASSVPIESDDQKGREPETTGSTRSVGRSAVELYATRHRLLTELKNEIASICSGVVCDPYQNISGLKKVLEIVYEEKYAPLLQTAVKLACASLTEVFIDIAPGYCINLASMDESTRKIKKDTRQLWKYEKTLLNVYQKYLRFLESYLRKLKRGTESTFNKKVGMFAVQQMCQLLLRLSHFNFRINLLAVLVPLMSCRDNVIRRTVCDTFCQLFDEDLTGTVSLDAVRLINQFMRKNNCRARPDMLDTLLHLRIKNASKAQPAEQNEKRLDPLKALSRRHMKYFKTIRRVQHHLKEIDAEEAEQVIQKRQTKIIEHLFNIYFRVLRSNPNRKVLRPVLEGMSTFAHLINVNFFDSLLSDMRRLLALKDLSVLDSLNCIHAVLIVLSKEGEALNVDMYHFQNMLYQLFPKVMNETRRELFLKEYQQYLKCLDMMINKRCKEISRHRVAAFVKRMCRSLGNMRTPELVASLLAIRTYLMSHPNLACLVDDDEPCTFAVYQPDLDDLEQSGAIGTKLDELLALQKHKSKLVRQLAANVQSNCSQEALSGIEPTLLSESPDKVLVLLTEASSSGQRRF